MHSLARINARRPAAMIVAVVGLGWLGTNHACAHGDLDERIAEVSRRLATNALDAQLYFERGELHRLHQDWPAAESDFNRAAQLQPAWRQVEAARARMLADAGRNTEALEAYDGYLRQATNEGLAFIERARLQVKLGAWERAGADYRRGLELTREPAPEHFLELAEVESRLNGAAGALTVLDVGMRRLGPVVSLQVQAVSYEETRGDIAAALRRLDSIIDRANRRETWLEQKGDLLRRAGRTEEAMAAYKLTLDALAKLPARLQSSPAMLELKTRVTGQLATLSRPKSPAGP